MLTYISLFSGVGGFDLGFDRAGMACQAQVEFNPKASTVLQHHWPNIKRFKDVCDVGKHNLPTVDVLCGGFPCQDVSVAGKRAGLDGERSGLWFEYLRIVQELKPRWVIIENVPGLLSSNKGADFAVILRGLAECGYCVAYRILDSKHFGVAQRRRRVFIVASLGNGSCAQILFESTGGTRDIEPGREARQEPSAYVIKGAAIGRRPENGPQRGEISADGTSYTLNATEIHAVAGTLAASGAGTMRPAGQGNELDFLIPFANQRIGESILSDASSTLRSNTGGMAHDLLVKAVDVRSLAMGSEVSGTLQAKKSGDWSLNYINPIVIEKPDRIKEWVEADDRIRAVRGDIKASTAQEHVYYKDNAVVNSLDVAHVPKMVNELSVRRLTPTECERLQGFPDGWTNVGKWYDSDTYRQMGNAVTVNVAEWIGQRIVAVEWAQICGLKGVA